MFVQMVVSGACVLGGGYMYQHVCVGLCVMSDGVSVWWGTCGGCVQRMCMRENI